MCTAGLFAVGEEELGEVPIPVLGLLEDVEEGLELGGLGEVSVMVELEDRHVGEFFVEVHDLIFDVQLSVAL